MVSRVKFFFFPAGKTPMKLTQGAVRRNEGLQWTFSSRALSLRVLKKGLWILFWTVAILISPGEEEGTFFGSKVKGFQTV